ncbi:MAG TPA: SDR family NAD(P)-dependent oxidoreductase [Burkholderiaceae bacterium]|jgi:NAD(P)-dependent dehydrogenase (short-subunit alcohol dehydrogenase family)
MRGLRAAVTGGGSGIGAAVAEALAREGVSVVLMGRNAARLREQAVRIGGEVQRLDVSDEASVQAAFEAIGPLDILVNNAGQVETAPLKNTTLDAWNRMLQVNLTGTFLCTRAVMGGMSERGFGRIINVASTAGLKGYAYVAAYCAAKHGVLGLTRALALELANKGVTVNAVCPGYTETDIVEQAVANIVAKTGRTPDEARALLAASNPQRRLIQPKEIATTVMWLARRESNSITGQSISISGGEVM